MSKALVAVAIGDTYTRQTEVMIESFLQHNPEWEPVRFYNGEVDKIIPDAAKGWNPFSKCEIGRWCALRVALKNGFDRALYSDGDLFWYDQYPLHGLPDSAMVLSPHYILASSMRLRAHQLIKDGIPNLGLILARPDAADMLDAFIAEVMDDSRRYFTHKAGIWLQCPMGIFAMAGWDATYDMTPGINVGNWNLKTERKVVSPGGRPQVLIEDLCYPLIGLHFSKYSRLRGKYGPVLDKLLTEYEWRLK